MSGWFWIKVFNRLIYFDLKNFDFTFFIVDFHKSILLQSLVHLHELVAILGYVQVGDNELDLPGRITREQEQVGDLGLYVGWEPSEHLEGEIVRDLVMAKQWELGDEIQVLLPINQWVLVGIFEVNNGMEPLGMEMVDMQCFKEFLPDLGRDLVLQMTVLDLLVNLLVSSHSVKGGYSCVVITENDWDINQVLEHLGEGPVIWFPSLVNVND